MTVSSVVKELFFEVAEQGGWLASRDFEKAKAIAKKMLLRGRPVEEVAEDTGLPYEAIISIV